MFAHRLGPCDPAREDPLPSLRWCLLGMKEGNGMMGCALGHHACRGCSCIFVDMFLLVLLLWLCIQWQSVSSLHRPGRRIHFACSGTRFNRLTEWPLKNTNYHVSLLGLQLDLQEHWCHHGEYAQRHHEACVAAASRLRRSLNPRLRKRFRCNDCEAHRDSAAFAYDHIRRQLSSSQGLCRSGDEQLCARWRCARSRVQCI